MILIAFWHGLRASEVVNLTPHNLQDGYLTIQRLKGSNKTIQPIAEHTDPLLNLRGALFEYCRAMHANQRIFPLTRQRFWQIIQQHGEAAGIPAHNRHPHILKHTIAMQTIHSAGIENARQYLGHKSMASTGEYLKVSDDAASIAIQQALKGV